jgi:hypothetical protein
MQINNINGPSFVVDHVAILMMEKFVHINLELTLEHVDGGL